MIDDAELAPGFEIRKVWRRAARKIGEIAPSTADVAGKNASDQILSIRFAAYFLS
jgi:hypothetical protein